MEIAVSVSPASITIDCQGYTPPAILPSLDFSKITNSDLLTIIMIG